MKPIRPRLILTLALSLFAAYGSSRARGAYLVYEGEPRSEIVVAEDPARIVPIAARILQEIIERMSGAHLPIVTERDSGRMAVFVGRSRYTDEAGIVVDDLDHDAWRLVSGETWLALLGRDDRFMIPEPYERNSGDVARALDDFRERTGLTVSRLPTHRVMERKYSETMNLFSHDGRGTANAVYGFLHDLGFRSFFPGRIGQVIPRRETIALPSVDRTVRPDFPLRWQQFYYHRFGQAQATEDEIKWQLSLGLNSGYEERGLGAEGHGLSSITTGRYAFPAGPDRDAFNRHYPETFYALYDGQRNLGANQCLSSEGLFETAVAYARAVFDLYDVRVLDMSPDDGFGRHCECELCEGKLTPERGINARQSDHVWGFINRVATEVYRTHPDRFISGGAYSGYLLPPEQVEFSPNVAVRICTWRTWIADDGRFTPESMRQLREDWLAKLPSGRLYLRDYYLHGREALTNVPVYFPRLIADDFKAVKGMARGETAEVFRHYDGWGRTGHDLATNHLNLYVASRYYWDAEQDIDELLEDYVRKFYGPAHAEMKAFIAFGEQHWRGMRTRADLIDRAFELLDQARARVEPESVVAERIQLIADTMDPLHLLKAQLDRERVDVPNYRALRTGLSGRTPMRNKLFDGRVDDVDFWPEGRREPLRRMDDGNAPEHRARFQVLREGNNLYIGIKCYDTDMANLNVTTTRHDDPRILEGDHVRLLVETLTHSYYEIAINPAGAIYDVDHSGDTPNSAWSSGARVAVHIGEDHWSAEIRLPIGGEGQRALDPLDGIDGNRPTNLYPWYFNVGRERIRGADVEQTAYVPTGESTLHVPERFARLWGR